MKASLARVGTATNLNELRGCEGAASAAYFKAFPHMLRTPDFSFSGRNRRPPRDPVNALLSLGYTLLANSIEAAVRTVGLDPYLGALHAPEAGRPSLVCDLIEEMRAPVVDALVLAALNQRAFKTSDFHDDFGDDVVIMPQATVRWFVTLFERRLNRKTLYHPTRKKLAWRDVFEQQARAFARALMDDQPYQGYVMR